MAKTPPIEPRPELSDADLIRRAQMEDLHAYEQLVRRYHVRIYGFIYNMTGNRDDAATLIQDVFVRAWNAIGHFNDPSGFSVWLDRIALHRTLKFCKTRKKQNPAYFEGFDPAIKQSESYKKLSRKGGLLRKMKLKEFQRKMNESLNAIPPKERATLLLHDIHGFSSLEIASIMNGTEAPARSRLAHAYKEIRTQFDDPTLDIKELLLLKAHARPDAQRVEKNIENIMHSVRAANKKPTLHHFPDKSLAWMFAQPRYGVAALFIIFLGLHLLERPVPKMPVAPLTRKNPALGVETNATPLTEIPAVNPTLPSLVEPRPFQ